MKGLLNKINYAGLEFAQSTHDRKCILIINRMSIILVLMMFTFACFAITFKIYTLIFFTVPFIAAFSMAPWFNSKGWLSFSKFFFCFASPTCLMFVCAFNSIELGDRFFFFTTATIPIILFRKSWLVYLLFFMNVSAFLFAEWYQNHHSPVLVIPKEIRAYYWYFSITAVFLVLFFIIRYFRSDTEVYEKELEEKNDLITEKNKEITDSIKYAKRIQQAHMPSDKHFEAHLNRLKVKK